MSKTQSLQFVHHPHPSPVAADQRAALLKNPGFGRVFSDHMVTIRYHESQGWHDARIEPRAPIPMDPAAAVLHYAQEVFEGLKAYRTADGGATLFRPQENARRFQKSAERLAMPILPEELFLEAVDRLVSIDRDWIPDGDGSLYLRPFMFANEVFLGVKPSSDYLFIVIASSVGAYFKTDAPAVSVWVSPDYTRAAPGGTGAAKCGGNYAASLLAQAEATQHGCDQVVFLDAVEQRWIEELGGMNIFFVFDDGSMVDAAAGRHDPARHHARLAAHPGQGQGHQGSRGPLLDRPMARRRRQRPPPRGLRLRHGRRRHADRHGPQQGWRVQDRQRRPRHQDRGIESGSGRHPARAHGRPAWLDPQGLLAPNQPLEQLAAVRHRLVRHDQHDGAVGVGKAERQHLRHELADLAWREVDHRRDLPADQASGR